jgi:hypothetical protein
MKNWKTTTAGVLTILVAVIHGVVLPMLAGQPANLAEVMGAVTVGSGLILAHDAVKPQ